MIIWFLVAALAAGLLILASVSAPTAKGKKRQNRVGHVNRELVAEHWHNVGVLSRAGGSSLRSAVHEADKLLDYVMRQSGYKGETMADRLKHAQVNLSNRNAVWEAHKLRNAYAHEVGFDLVPQQAREAIEAYRQALTDLGAL
jgi:hypothetical protein